MASDEELTHRVRQALGQIEGLVEKRMFGGVGFLVNGNMACGIHKGKLIVRVGSAQYEDALSQPHVKQFDMTGRPMSGWVMVEAGGFERQADLEKWVKLGIAYAMTLTPK